jgi:chemotaxis protein methyltransferase CheR
MDLHQQTLSDESLYSLIQSRTGLVLNPHQRSDVSAMLDNLVVSAKAEQPDNLVLLLSNYPLTHPLWQRIVHLITVGETYFFRNRAQFDALRFHILPALIDERRKAGNKQLRLWSAGSATGEEPYSLAILLRELLPDIETWSITLLATDINEGYLEQARNGLYRLHSFRSETPSGIRERWFVEERDGYRLTPAVRNAVIFRPLNLISEEYPAFENSTMYMDLIFCRNVTIYFDREITRLIAGRFHRALNQNGWLVVGHSEPQSDIYQGFTARNFKDTVIYQKATDEASESEETSPVKVRSGLKMLPTSSARKQRAVTPSIQKPEPAPVPPPNEDLWNLAKHAADVEKWDEARAWLNKAEQKDQFRPEIHYLHALVELNGENFEQALQLLRRAVYCNPKFALAHYTLGDLYHRQGERKEAARHWRLALNAVETLDSQQPVPFSDDLSLEMLVELLSVRLSGL